MNPRWLSVAAILLFLLPAAGCTDPCDGVLCGPAPVPLEVLVTDTVSVDTTLYWQVGNGMIDSVDTVLVVRRYTANADVTLRSVSGSDTTAFETLSPDGILYTRASVDGLPATLFLVVADLNGRRVLKEAEVRHGEGCCPVTVVGHFEMALPLR